MNVFILTDLEGIPGVTSIDCMERGSSENLEARRLLTHWLNKTAEYCRAYGAETVYYLDGHGGGGNIDECDVDPSLIRITLADWSQLMSEGKIDCQIELGAHARAGTLGGFLDHTISSKGIFSITFNGREYSELALHAVLCGAYGVPIVACIGDLTACEQAKEYIPKIETGVVKVASCRNCCEDLPDADRIIRETVGRALKNYKSIPPFSFELPAIIEQTFYRTDMCESALKKQDGTVTRISARTLQKTVGRIDSYFDLRI